MKELLKGILLLPASLLVFTPVILIGLIYNVFYPVVMAVKEKNPITFFRIWWRLIDGTLATIGEMLYQVAEKYDMLGNVYAEWIEDLSTTNENTRYGEKLITISAATGELEHKKRPRSKAVKGLSKALNVAFNESRHALGSWIKYLAIKEIEDRNLKGKK